MPQQDTVPVHPSSVAPFAMVPRWLVDLGDSRAVHLYALLTDWEWRDENPTRAELAEAMGVSPATVDRTLRALRDAGAVTVIHQSRAGSQVASVYVLEHGWPEDGASPVTRGGLVTSDEGPGASPVTRLSSDEETSDTRERAGRQPDLFGDDSKHPPAKAPRRKPERPIPEGWGPDDRVREWAATNAPGVDVDAEAGRFVDHALSVDRRARDWSAAFRNWLRKARPAPASNGRAEGPGRRYEGAESHDAGYWTPEGAALLVDEEDDRG